MDSLRLALGGVAKELSNKVPDGATLGLGSGSTVATLLEELSPLLSRKHVDGVPTSTQIEMVASKNGIRIVPFPGSVDLVIDGADQVDERLNLVKGGGGALLKEKVVMGSAKDIAIVASEKKFSRRLCDDGVRVPIEVVPMARESVKARLSKMGGAPEERVLPKGYPYFTENGNVIFDTLFEPIEDPAGLEAKLKSVPGVAEVGIFTFAPMTVYRLNEDGTFDSLKKSP